MAPLQEAFALLVKRHGPMVWGVCSRVLRCPHDAADSFQATFLVLARRAESISPRDRVGFWLYGVARLTALRARVAGAKRCRREMTVEELPEPSASNDDASELKSLIDQTLSGLPARYGHTTGFDSGLTRAAPLPVTTCAIIPVNRA